MDTLSNKRPEMKKTDIKIAEFIWVTPTMAQRWLDECNTQNRCKRGWWLEALCAAMLRGEWITTHQGIAFAASGRLLDGQHRLEAIVKSGMAIEMLVVYGLDDAAFGAIDTGVKRTISDLTGLPKRTAEAARFAAFLVFGGTVTATQAAFVAAAGLAEVHDALIESCGTTKAYYGSAPMRMAAVSLVMDGHNREYVFKTYTDLVMERFSDLPLVAQGLIRQVNAGKTRASMTRDVYARGLKALNPNNQTITKIQISDADVEAASAYGRSVIKRALAAA